MTTNKCKVCGKEISMTSFDLTQHHKDCVYAVPLKEKSEKGMTSKNLEDKLEQFKETGVMVRTEDPFTLVYPDSFDVYEEKRVMENPMITMKIFYKNRYTRLTVDKIFLDGRPDIVSSKIIDCLLKISNEVQDND